MYSLYDCCPDILFHLHEQILDLSGNTIDKVTSAFNFYSGDLKKSFNLSENSYIPVPDNWRYFGSVNSNLFGTHVLFKNVQVIQNS